jgi:hypothetical protein
MIRATIMASFCIASAASAQQLPPSNDVWPTVLALRARMLEIYSADREKCLHPVDAIRDYCGAAKSELEAIQQLDREIVEAQRPQQQTGHR